MRLNLTNLTTLITATEAKRQLNSKNRLNYTRSASDTKVLAISRRVQLLVTGKLDLPCRQTECSN